MSRIPVITPTDPQQPFVLATSTESHAAEPTPEELEMIIQATQELFPGELIVATEWDPEYPVETYTVLQVRAKGEVRSIVERRSSPSQLPREAS